MLQVNSTLFFQITNFLALIWILNKLLFRPFLRLVEQREEETRGARTKAEHIMASADLLKGTYETGVSEATSGGMAMSEVHKKAGRTEGERIVDEARTKSAGYITTARVDLQHNLDEVRKQVRGMSVTLAGQMAKKILGRDPG